MFGFSATLISSQVSVTRDFTFIYYAKIFSLLLALNSHEYFVLCPLLGNTLFYHWFDHEMENLRAQSVLLCYETVSRWEASSGLGGLSRFLTIYLDSKTSSVAMPFYDSIDFPTYIGEALKRTRRIWTMNFRKMT